KPGLPLADDVASPRLTLDAAEVDELDAVVESTIRTHADALARRAAPPAPRAPPPGPAGLRRFVRYYRAHLGQGPFPHVDCNAPWMSVVIEAHGDVRPCFFHPAVGNLRERPLTQLLEEAMPAFRRGLDVPTNPTCQRCVCRLRVGL